MYTWHIHTYLYSTRPRPRRSSRSDTRSAGFPSPPQIRLKYETRGRGDSSNLQEVCTMQLDCGLRRERGSWSIENRVTEFQAPLSPPFTLPAFIQPAFSVLFHCLQYLTYRVLSRNRSPYIFHPFDRMYSCIKKINR